MSLCPIVFLVGQEDLVLHHFFFCEMFSGVHLNHEATDFVCVVDRNSNGLAQFLMFVEIASEGDDVLWWCPQSHEIFFGLIILSSEYLVPCCV